MSELQTVREPLISLGGQAYHIVYDLLGRNRSNYRLEPGTQDEGLKVEKALLPDHLTKVGSITVVDSTHSGVGRENRDLYTPVLRPLLEMAGVKHTYIKTQSPTHIEEFSNSLDLSQDHTVVILSGDTSIMELANALYKRKFPVGARRPQINLVLVPFGTGNGLSISAGIEDEVVAIQKLFTATNSETLPLYRASLPDGAYTIKGEDVSNTDILFGVIVSFATHANLVWIAEQPDLKPLGVDRFKVAAGKVAQQPLDFHVQLTTLDNELITDATEHTYLNLMSLPCAEKGYWLSPDSHMNEQKLHLLRIAPVEPQELMQMMIMGYMGKDGPLTKQSSVEYKPIQQLEIIATLLNDDVANSTTCIDGILIRFKDPKGKKIRVSNVDETTLPFSLQIVGMVAL